MSRPILRTFGDSLIKKYKLEDPRWRAKDGRLLVVDNALKPMTDSKKAALKKKFDKRLASSLPIDKSGIWRYREFLPAFKPYYTAITLFEGGTPVFSMPNCSSYCGVQDLLAKHMGRNPTGSIDDNGMTAAMTMAKLAGVTRVGCASTGNSAASMAAYASRAGIKSIAFLPADKVTAGNYSQVLDYAATTLLIDGDFDTVMKIAEEVCAQAGIYLVNSINPYFIEGSKTVMIELLHQLDWKTPGWVVVPDGMLGVIAAFGKAFEELKTTGFIDKVPRILVIQAEGANPFYTSVTNKAWPPKPIKVDTRAASIGVGNPLNWEMARAALELTNGIVEQVSEMEIAMARNYAGRDGVGADPVSGAAIAGCKKAMSRGSIGPEETMVCILTGNMLKDTDYAIEYHTDNLFCDAKRTAGVEGAVRIPTYGIHNRPVRLPADTEEVLKYIRLKS